MVHWQQISSQKSTNFGFHLVSQLSERIEVQEPPVHGIILQGNQPLISETNIFCPHLITCIWDSFFLCLLNFSGATPSGIAPLATSFVLVSFFPCRPHRYLNQMIEKYSEYTSCPQTYRYIHLLILLLSIECKIASGDFHPRILVIRSLPLRYLSFHNHLWAVELSFPR